MTNGQLGEESLLEGVHCRIAIGSAREEVVVMRLSGWDAGEFGDIPRNVIERHFASDKPLTLFIDAREVRGATTDVSGDWAQWLAKHRDRFCQINMLTGSPFIQLTANFVRRFADLGELMRIYTDAAAFDEALGEAAGR